MKITQLIASSNFIAVNKELIKEVGIDEAIILGQLASEYDYWLKRGELQNDYFYSTIENVEDNTGLSEYRQRKALNNLKEQNIVDVKIFGMPAKRYIKINDEQLLEIFKSQFLKNSRTSSENTQEQVPEKLKGNKKDNKKENNNIINNSTTQFINDVIEYMNTCGEYENFKVKRTFNFNSKASSNIRVIKARINEGYTLDDFKDVIYNAYEKFVVNEFKGLNGKSSVQYYQPSTIFTSSKMEQYKNEYKQLIGE